MYTCSFYKVFYQVYRKANDKKSSEIAKIRTEPFIAGFFLLFFLMMQFLYLIVFRVVC